MTKTILFLILLNTVGGEEHLFWELPNSVACEFAIRKFEKDDPKAFVEGYCIPYVDEDEEEES